MRKKLFVSNAPSLSGASLTFYEILKKYKENVGGTVDILLLGDGADLDAYAKMGRVIKGYPSAQDPKYILYKVLSILRLTKQSYLEFILSFVNFNSYNLIFGNTVLSSKVLYHASKAGYKGRAVLYLHELERVSESYFKTNPPERNVFEIVDKILCVSRSVVNYVTTKYGVPSSKMVLANPAFPQNNEINQAKESIRQQLYIKDEVVIGLIGYPSLIKGFDVIPQLVIALKKLNLNRSYKFLILGSSSDSSLADNLQYDLQKIGGNDKIVFVAPQKYPCNYIQIFDIFLMVSREESYSFATLQAMLQKVPVVSYNKIGGPNEFLNSENAYIADYLDVTQLAEQILRCVLNLAETEIKVISAYNKAKKIVEADHLKHILCHIN